MHRYASLALLVIALAATSSAGDDGPTVSFRLPDPCGNAVQVEDLGSRYALLVYQGIP